MIASSVSFEFKVRCIALSKYKGEDNDGMEVGDIMDGWEHLRGSNCVSVITKHGKESALFDGEFEFVTE